MSHMDPHLYCSDCSNAIHRERDRALSWRESGLAVLATITSSLPDCECGGRFLPGANPKCPTCHCELRNRSSAIERLSDPNIILIDGAVLYGDDGPLYGVMIKSR